MSHVRSLSGAAVNRLDRLTSGLMIIPLNADRARQLTTEFVAGTIKKVYVARCQRKFPTEEVVCEEPLLTVDRQMGLNIVHPKGKPAKTIFNRIHYDAETDTSVVLCEPFTGRSHQLRVHLQYLGYPIANDPIYSEKKIWGDALGKGGINIVPSDERMPPEPPCHILPSTEAFGNPESLTKSTAGHGEQPAPNPYPKLLPRETGEDIGMGSPVPLSREAVGVITQLRNMKDENEDWSRWRDVVFRAKGALIPHGFEVTPLPASNRRKRGGHANIVDTPFNQKMADEEITAVQAEPSAGHPSSTALSYTSTPSASDSSTTQPQLSDSEVLDKISKMEPQVEAKAVVQEDNLYCPECYLPLHPDPKPEKLYIFLHALRYTTSLGTFETDMPTWAAEGWTWDQS